MKERKLGIHICTGKEFARPVYFVKNVGILKFKWVLTAVCQLNLEVFVFALVAVLLNVAILVAVLEDEWYTA